MSSEQRLRELYLAFNARDIDAVLAVMTEDVNWPNAWEGGRLSGRDSVRSYWTRQWAEIDPVVEPVRIASRPDGRIDVVVDQLVRNLDGELLAQNRGVHRYELRDGLVARMDVVDS